MGSATFPWATATSVYNATSGRLETVTDADGAVLTYAYDAFGRVARELHTSGAVTLKDLGGTGGRTIDSLGRTTAETEAVSGVARTWTYPVNAATGLQETMNYGGSPASSLAVARNGREMETARTATIATGVTVTLATSDTSTGRDTAGRWKQHTIQRTGYTAKTQNRAFDAAGRLATQSGLGFSSAGSYAYDANSGKKTTESLPLALGGTISGSFTYYAGGRLAEATTNAVAESFSFDEAGSLTLDTLTDVGETKLFYDTANRLTSSAYTPALDGAATTTTYYGWDATNAWRTCQGPSASPTQANEPIDLSYNAQGRMSSYANADASTTANYTYDAAGQRTKSVVAVAGTTTTTSFAYDGLMLLKLSATQGATTWRIDYLYDEEGAPYGGVYRSPASSTSPTYFTVVTTDRGDVVELCDADGAAFAAYRYDAWGLPQGSGSYATGVWTQATSLVTSTLAGQIASRQLLRYAGYAYDAESGLYYCSARYYDPATRQWTTGDPAKADGEESAYQYCGGDSVGNVDPAGDYFIVNGERVYGIRETSPFRLRALAYERTLVGKKMRKKVNDWFWGKGNSTSAAWCEALQAYVYKSCGSKANWHRGKDATVTTLYNDARYHSKASGKRLITPTSGGAVNLSLAKPGDLVLFDWDPAGWNHVGMVKKRGVVIEGNSPEGDTPVKLHYDRWNSGIKAVIRISK